MASWVGERLELDLEGVTEAKVWIVGGDVSVTSTTGAAHVEVVVRVGPPAEVSLAGGRLVVRHPIDRALVARAEATVVVAIPAAAPVEVDTVSADVFVAGVGAGVEVATVSGRLTTSGVAGPQGLVTVSGEIEAEGVDGPLELRSVSGAVVVAGTRAESLHVRTVSGDITVDLAEVGHATLDTTSGEVAVRVPAGAGVALDARTISGRLATEFELLDVDAGRRHLRGRAGDGRAAVRVDTTSGDFTLLRRAPVPVGPAR